MSSTNVRYSWSSVPAPVREHLGVALSASAAVLVAVRLLAVAGYQPDNAYAVLKAQGTASVVVGSLIEPLVVAPLVGGFLLVVWAFDQSAQRSWATKSICIGFLLGAVAIAPLGFAVLSFLMAVSLRINGWTGTKLEATRTRLSRRNPNVEPERDPPGWNLVMFLFKKVMTVRTTLMIFVVVIAASAIGSTRLWLPLEEFKTPTGVVEGYELASSEDELIVLGNHPRTILRIPATSSRRFCTTRDDFTGLPSWASLSLAGILSDGSAPKKCKFKV